jgi:glycosyltransferase involved in cell wall biosynthesis
MRVLVSAFACAPHKGSEESVGWNWALETARLGHEVTVLTEIEDRVQVEEAVDCGGLPGHLRFAFFMPDWLHRLRHRGLGKGYPGLTMHLVHLTWQVLARREVRRRFPGLPFDLIHHITYAGIRHPTLLGGLGVPLVLGPLGGGERAPYRLRRGLPWKGWLKDAIRDLHTLVIRIDPVTRHACRHALAVFVKTGESRDALPAAGRAKAVLQSELGIHDLPVPPSRERPAGAPLRLLFAGRFLYWKGMDLGFRALAEHRARGGRARLTMVGQGPDEGAWRALVSELDLDGAVDWLGYVPHAGMNEIYRRHDALLFPSLHDSGGNVALEAFGQGLPVICLDLGGPGEMVTDETGRRIRTSGRGAGEVVRAMADAMDELERDPGRCVRLGETAFRRARDFLWSYQLRRFYDEVERRLALQE